MKLTFTKSINTRLLIALSLTGTLLATMAIGCSDAEDDDDSGGSDASVDSGTSKGGKGGGSGGKGGSTAGKGGGGGAAGTVAAPTTEAECNTLIEESGETNELSKCMCKDCMPAFGECMVNANCAEVLRCVNRTGCRGESECTKESACSKEISVLMESDITLALGLSDLSDCQAKKCLPDSPDSGT